MKYFIALLAMVGTLTAGDWQAQSLLHGSDVYLADNTAITNSTVGVSYVKPGGIRGTNSASLGWVSTASVSEKQYGGVYDNASITLAITGINAAGTNVATFVFERSADGTYWDGANTFSVAHSAPSPNGATQNVIMTNVPTTFLQGARFVRIKTITNSDVAGNSTNVINAVTFNALSR